MSGPERSVGGHGRSVSGPGRSVSGPGRSVLQWEVKGGSRQVTRRLQNAHCQRYRPASL